MKKIASFVLLIFGISTILIAFQNCGVSPQELSVSQKNSESINSSSSSDLKIDLVTSDTLTVDCSLPSSSYKIDISGAGSDILLCQEYSLDLPIENPRSGESYKCDSSDKFVPPPTSWSYDVGQRQWSKETYTNSGSYIPGDYRLYVKDNQGKMSSSNLFKIRHSGFANCLGSSSSISNNNRSSGPVPSSNSSTRSSTGSPTPGSNGACNPAGSTLVQVQTQLPEKSFQRTRYENIVKPSTIYSFAFKTPNTTDVYTGRLVATKLSNSIGNKWLIISTCRGDIQTQGKDEGCARYDTESTSVYYVINKDGFKSNVYCHLKPNTQYYANVVTPGVLTGLQTNGCTNEVNCGFSFNGQ